MIASVIHSGRTLWIRGLLLTAVVLGLTAPATATTVLRVSTEQLVEHADLIVVARVDSVQTIETDGAIDIYTEFRLDVREVLQGTSAQSPVLLRLPGGEVGGRKMIFEGAPPLEVGASYVLMLQHIPGKAYGTGESDAYVPVGLGQGVWKIDATTATASQVIGDIVLVNTADVQPESGSTTSLIDLRAVIAGGQR